MRASTIVTPAHGAQWLLQIALACCAPGGSARVQFVDVPEDGTVVIDGEITRAHEVALPRGGHLVSVFNAQRTRAITIELDVDRDRTLSFLPARFDACSGNDYCKSFYCSRVPNDPACRAWLHD